MEPHVDLRSRNGLGRGDYKAGRANRLVRFLPSEAPDKLKGAEAALFLLI